MGPINLSKLSRSEELAVHGAMATMIGGAVAASTWPRPWGLAWLGAILGVAMLVIVFLPQMLRTARLPGRKGRLMVAVGGAAAPLMAFVLLTTFRFTFEGFDLSSLLFLIAVAGALVMGWAGWQAFQAERGKVGVGMSGGKASPRPPPRP